MRPETRYARSGELAIAYQTFGDGPYELVIPLPFLSHLEHNWEYPPLARFLTLLASLGRVTLFNQRGVGLSDPVAGVPTLEERVDDMIAVMDASGVERAVPLAMSDGGPVAMLLAATHPDRVERLHLYATFAKRRGAPALLVEDPDRVVAALSELWGTGAVTSLSAPSLADDERHMAWASRLERLAASPGTIVKLARASLESDVRDVLPSIRVPTAVVHRRGDGLFPLDGGREVAELIPGARFVELEGEDHAIYVRSGELLEEIEEFLTGARHRVDLERVLQTILFTDIVGSTDLVAQLGDLRWRELLDAHDRSIRAELNRSEAQHIRSTGDGFLATFDGPVRGVRAALAAIEAAAGLGLELRAGLHTGDCHIVGDDIGGMAVHIAARVAALAGAGEVLVTSTVRDLAAGAELGLSDRGVHELKGVPRTWRLFSVAEDAATRVG